MVHDRSDFCFDSTNIIPKSNKNDCKRLIINHLKVAFSMCSSIVGFHLFMNCRMIFREVFPHAIMNYGKDNKAQPEEKPGKQEC
jgi:hypothetical protein